jgi:hypothetical protein
MRVRDMNTPTFRYTKCEPIPGDTGARFDCPENGYYNMTAAEMARADAEATVATLPRLPKVMQRFGCSADSAQRFIDLRDEGYPAHQAALMAGLTDPPEYGA